MTPTKMLVKSKSLIQVLTRNVLLPKTSLPFWFYLARWIFQAIWYNHFSPFSIIHAVLTNSTSALRKFYLEMVMTEWGIGPLWVWTGLMNIWHRSHTENGLSPKQGEMLQWVANIQKPHAQQHSAQERHRRDTLLKVVTRTQQIQAGVNGHLALFYPIQGRTEHLSADVQRIFLTNI